MRAGGPIMRGEAESTANWCVDARTVEEYVAKGWWGTAALTDVVRAHARDRPDELAFISESGTLTWAQYESLSSRIAHSLLRLDLARGDRVGVLLPDGPSAHAAFLGIEKAGLVTVGLSARAGQREIEHLLSSTQSHAFVTHESHRGQPMHAMREALRLRGIELDHHLVLPQFDRLDEPITVNGEVLAEEWDVGDRTIDERRIGPNELFLINSTSGTTGLPKRVKQFQNRWFYYQQLVSQSVELRDSDVFMSVLPAALGFGLWSAHFVPTITRIPVVLTDHFSVRTTLQAIEKQRVTILCCVTTQLVMMLNSEEMASTDCSSLRAVFTGGEPVPHHRAAEFEETTGASVLQFYGSNETGAFSRTTVHDSREDRLSTCGRVITDMSPRLYADDGTVITEPVVAGQPACRGPATCAGYHDDPEANASLLTEDGWMLMEDLVTIDARGYVHLIGRKTDFIIRGGKNISAVSVEEAVATHPSVTLVAAVAVPDPVFGERVGVFVELRGKRELSLDELVAHLTSAGVSKEMFPEHLFVVDELPRASGGKIAKKELRDQVATLFPGR